MMRVRQDRRDRFSHDSKSRTQSRTQDRGSRTQDPGQRIQDSGSRTPDPGLRMQDPGHMIQDPGHRTAATGSATTQDPGVDRHQEEIWGKLGYSEHEVQTDRRKK